MTHDMTQAEIHRKNLKDVIPTKRAKTGKRANILKYYKEEKECRWSFCKDPMKYDEQERKRVMVEVRRIMCETTF